MKAASNLLKSVLHKKRYEAVFNGTTGKITAGSIVLPPRFTIEARIRKVAYGGQKSFFSNRGGGGGCYAGVTTQPMLFLNSGTPSTFVGNATLAAGQRYHLIFTNDGVNTKSFIDGVLDRSMAQTFPGTTGTVGIGWDPSIGTEFWDGSIDELRVYARDVSDEEAAAHAKGVFPSEVGLIAYWGMDDGAALQATDLSGFARHGTFDGGMSWVEHYPYPGDERKFVMADLYTFTLVGGLTTRYTSADIDITANGNVYSSAGPKFRRSRIREVRGVEVDTLSIELAADTSHLISGVPWLKAIKTGLLDGATVKLERAFLTDWRCAPAGVLTRFAGRVAPSSAGRTRGTIQVKSDLELLNVMWPRNLYQPGCRNTLYDAGCTVSRAAFTVTGTVQAGSTTTSVNVSQSNAADFATLGRIVFTSGALAGVTRSIKLWVPGNAKLALPLPVAPNTGDGVSIEAGCAKRLNEDCIAKFNNMPNFRAEPFIPIPETVL